MKLRRRFRLSVRSCVPPLLVCLLPCLAVEFFSFWVASIFWRIPPASNPETIKILIVSDPQLIGYINEPKWIGFLSRWDADRYLRRGYASVSRSVRPDLELFLGDLFDEGVLFEDDQQFADARARFLDIFPLDKQQHSANRVYLAGDNDVGGEMEPVYARQFALFKKYFPPQFHNNESEDKLNQLVSIYQTDLLNIGEVNRVCCGGQTVVAEEGQDRTKTVRLLLSHFPVLPYLTPKLEQQLRPINVVLSAHDHTTGVYMHWRQRRNPTQRQRTDAGGGGGGRFNAAAAASALLSDTFDVQWKWTVSMVEPSALPLVEFKSPTVSYRMGVQKMGYGLLVVTPFVANGTALVHFSVLWLPSRYLQLTVFLCLLIVCLVWTTALLLVGSGGCRCWRWRRDNITSSNWHSRQMLLDKKSRA